VNFTREPIIETIITPKEGYRLIIRSSKGISQEEYSVDALEVVSFGPAIFYRSSERPKPFLVPVADFEVVEVKEARVILKNAPLERSIKIGGGKEAPKQSREPILVAVEEESAPAAPPQEQNLDKKRDRRHRRRRRGERPEVREEKGVEAAQTPAEEAGEGGDSRDEAQVSSPTIKTLFPPPTTLISQTIARYKDQAISERAVLTKQVKESVVSNELSEVGESKEIEGSETKQEDIPLETPFYHPMTSDSPEDDLT